MSRTSSASRHAVYAVLEAAYATVPVTPSFERVRLNSITLGATKAASVSEEIRPDRMIADHRHGLVTIGGDIAGELSYGTYDTLIQAALMGTWAAKGAVTDVDISAAAADNSFNSASSFFEDLDLSPGDLITVAGFTGDTNNNGVWEVVTKTNSKITVVDPGGLIVDDAAGESVTVTAHGHSLLAGTVRRSFTVMRHFTDLVEADKPFHLYRGVEYNTLNLSLTPGEKAMVTFGVMGHSPLVQGTAPAGSTLGSATTTRVFDSFTGSIKEGGTTIGIVTEISLTLENGLEAQPVLFSKYTLEPSVQRSNLTGQMTVYFQNADMLEKFLNETPSSLDFRLTDLDGNSYRFLIPNISYTGGQPDASGQGNISLSMPFQAILDPDVGSQIKIDRIPAAL